MMLFDSHCHLQDAAFEPAEVADVLARAASAGLAAALVCGYDAPSNWRALEIAADSDIAFAAVGFHPHDATELTPEALSTLATQAEDGRVVAVGEIGLDFYRDLSPRDVQFRALEAQLDLAVAVGKPVSVHSRSAEDAIYATLARYAARCGGRAPGVMHCFGGTLEQARRYVELGFLVSLSCAITYPKNAEARRVASELPLESLAVETDAPYLPPQARRGNRNEPAFVVAAAEEIARARGLQIDEVAEATSLNACRVFGIRVPAGAR